MSNTEIAYLKFLKLTGDPLAASNLVLAEAMEHQPPDMMTVREAAKYLRVAETSVYALCSAGQLAYTRIGTGRGVIRIRREDLKSYQERSHEPSVGDHLARHR